MKRKIRYMAYSAIYTARIHANVLCRLRFLQSRPLQSRNTGRHITNGAYMQISLFAASGRL